MDRNCKLPAKNHFECFFLLISSQCKALTPLYCFGEGRENERQERVKKKERGKKRRDSPLQVHQVAVQLMRPIYLMHWYLRTRTSFAKLNHLTTETSLTKKSKFVDVECRVPVSPGAFDHKPDLRLHTYIQSG